MTNTQAGPVHPGPGSLLSGVAADEQTRVVTTFQFRITEVFDVQARPGLLVAGVVIHGAVRPGDVLREAATQHSFPLLGIDLACGRVPGSGGFSLIVDRAHRDYVQPGRILIAGQP